MKSTSRLRVLSHRIPRVLVFVYFCRGLSGNTEERPTRRDYIGLETWLIQGSSWREMQLWFCAGCGPYGWQGTTDAMAERRCQLVSRCVGLLIRLLTYGSWHIQRRRTGLSLDGNIGRGQCQGGSSVMSTQLSVTLIVQRLLGYSPGLRWKNVWRNSEMVWALPECARCWSYSMLRWADTSTRERFSEGRVGDRLPGTCQPVEQAIYPEIGDISFDWSDGGP